MAGIAQQLISPAKEGFARRCLSTSAPRATDFMSMPQVKDLREADQKALQDATAVEELVKSVEVASKAFQEAVVRFFKRREREIIHA